MCALHDIIVFKPVFCTFFLLHHISNAIGFVLGVFSPTVQTIIILALRNVDSGLPAGNNNKITLLSQVWRFPTPFLSSSPSPPFSSPFPTPKFPSPFKWDSNLCHEKGFRYQYHKLEFEAPRNSQPCSFHCISWAHLELFFFFSLKLLLYSKESPSILSFTDYHLTLHLLRALSS